MRVTVARQGAPDPILKGISIRDFATICNAIYREGKRAKEGFVYCTNGKSHAFEASLMGVELRFEARRDYTYNGYALCYRLSGKGWLMECSGSTFPPGNTVKGEGHYNLAAFDLVRFDYLRGNKDRCIFGFRLGGPDQDRYRADMSLVKLMIPMWEAA